MGGWAVRCSWVAPPSIIHTAAARPGQDCRYHRVDIHCVDIHCVDIHCVDSGRWRGDHKPVAELLRHHEPAGRHRQPGPAQPAECRVLPILFSRQSAIHRAAARTLLPRRAQHHITSAALQEAGARVQECGHRQGEINAVLVHGNQCPVPTPACTPPPLYQQQHHSSSSSSEAPNSDHECTLHSPRLLWKLSALQCY